MQAATLEASLNEKKTRVTELELNEVKLKEEIVRLTLPVKVWQT